MRKKEVEKNEEKKQGEKTPEKMGVGGGESLGNLTRDPPLGRSLL